MPELESRQTLPRSEIAEYLHEFADELDTDHGGTGDVNAERTGDDIEAEQTADAIDAGRASDDDRSKGTLDDARSPDTPVDESDRVDPETGERLPPEDDAQVTTADEDKTTGSETAHSDAAHSDTTHSDATSSDADPDATTTEDRVTLIVGDDSATVNPPETADFEIEVDSDSSLVGSGEQQRVTFELEWEVEDATDEDQIEIT